MPFYHFQCFIFPVVYESYVGWDKQLYNHNSDDGETKERSASPSVWARHSSSITQLAGRMSDIVLLVSVIDLKTAQQKTEIDIILLGLARNLYQFFAYNCPSTALAWVNTHTHYSSDRRMQTCVIRSEHNSLDGLCVRKLMSILFQDWSVSSFLHAIFPRFSPSHCDPAVRLSYLTFLLCFVLFYCFTLLLRPYLFPSTCALLSAILPLALLSLVPPASFIILWLIWLCFPLCWMNWHWSSGMMRGRWEECVRGRYLRTTVGRVGKRT